MRNKRVTLVTVILLCLGLSELKAQETITTTGGNATGSGGTVSYTFGQLGYITNTGINGSVAQGVQQAYEISIVSGLNETTVITLFCSVYPNPTVDFLILKVENCDKVNLAYQLYDITGKLMESKNITSGETTISVGNLVSATYFLKVIVARMEVKSFKIIKN